MRAVRLEEIGVMRIVDLEEPIPGHSEIVVETIATGICGSDIHGYTGENGRRFPGQVMGHETVGRIHATGREVDPALYPVGALVTINPVIVPRDGASEFIGREQHHPARRVAGVDPTIVAAFAERYVMPEENIIVLEGLEAPLHGALIEPLAVALHAVHRAGVSTGQRVLVLGGGPIGQSVILAALRAGAIEVFVTEPDMARRELCSALGATVVTPSEGEGVPAVLRALTGGVGVDLAIDAVGSSVTMSDALNSTVLGGRVCLVGMAQPELELNAYRVSTDERTIIGSFTYPASTFEEAARWVAAGDESFERLISAVVPLSEADATFSRLAHRPDVPGKVLLQFDAETIEEVVA